MSGFCDPIWVNGVVALWLKTCQVIRHFVTCECGTLRYPNDFTLVAQFLSFFFLFRSFMFFLSSGFRHLIWANVTVAFWLSICEAKFHIIT